MAKVPANWSCKRGDRRRRLTDRDVARRAEQEVDQDGEEGHVDADDGGDAA
jgi:hypothetical protein